MSKLAELIEKKKERKQSMPTKGSYYSAKEDFEFEFKRCEEKLFFYVVDKFPLAFPTKEGQEPRLEDLLEAMNNLIYECVVIDGNKSLKDKEVQEALGVNRKDPENLIGNSARALIEDFTERLELGNKILEFSGFGKKGNKQVQEIKN